MNQIKLSSKTKNIFFDFDGVIVDSNKFKEDAINNSIRSHCKNQSTIKEALIYFNKYAGIGREKKLLKFFEMNIVKDIMQQYGNLCNSFYLEANPTNGSIELLKNIRKELPFIKTYILSGGEKNEINRFISINKMGSLLNECLCSENSKSIHLKKKGVSKEDIFFGDSVSDLKVAKEYKLRFILINGFTSINSEPNLLERKYAELIIKDLSKIKLTI